jgi:hypothetical protein
MFLECGEHGESGRQMVAILAQVLELVACGVTLEA